MKLLIAGSRSIKDFNISKHVPKETKLIISGGAVGVDTLAEKFADESGIEKRIFLPEYSIYGKAAPIVRNKQMVDFCDRVLIIWDGKSRGTKSTIDYAKKQGKKVEVVILEKAL